ncbi:hypothetical protein ACE6H2_014832 [Prunus campanulata]
MQRAPPAYSHANFQSALVPFTQISSITRSFFCSSIRSPFCCLLMALVMLALCGVCFAVVYSISVLF